MEPNALKAADAERHEALVMLGACQLVSISADGWVADSSAFALCLSWRAMMIDAVCVRTDASSSSPRVPSRGPCEQMAASR